MIETPKAKYPDIKAAQLQLSRQKIQELRRRSQILSNARKPHAETSPSDTASRNKRKDVVSCQCGWNQEEDDMVC